MADCDAAFPERSPYPTRLYRLRLAPNDFKLRGQAAPGFAILHERTGEVCIPVHYHLARMCRTGFARGSIVEEAKILREWWAALDVFGIAWWQANDDSLIRFYSDLQELAQSGRGERRGGSATRIAHKCQVIFGFYNLVPTSVPLILLPSDIRDRIARGWTFVGPDPGLNGRSGPKCPFTERGGQPAPSDPFGRARARKRRLKTWEFAPPSGRSVRRPRGHVDDDLERDILMHLRNRPPDKKQAWRSDVLGERDWLIGRVMAEAGLRRAEVAGLSISQIQDALTVEGAPLPRGRSLQNCSKAERDQLRRWIDEDFAGRKQRETFSVIVTGKGAKTRNVPFPHDLLYDLLTWCIWGHRQTIVNTCHGRDVAYCEPDTLFLTHDGQGLMPETVGKYVKAAFSAAGSPLSGHRLRALFLTRLALRLWTEHFEASNFRWTQDVEQTVLVRVAEAAGHTLITTTIEHYLQLAQLVYWSANKESLRLIREHTLVLRGLPSQRAALIIQLAQRFADLGALHDQASLLEEVVKAILQDSRLQPPATVRPTAAPPHLRALPAPVSRGNGTDNVVAAVSRSTSNGRRDPWNADD
ncbi:hypothetical protein [Azospirillum sp. Marseille-Q6669]